jgi:hypothetical protein
MLKSKHFKTEHALLEWANSKELLGRYLALLNPNSWIINIFKDVTNGDWIIFYIEEDD